ncbi:MAG: hypothetical protein DI603_01770 [Roseateles depolymerans]|uniref:SCP domain-containing protein n=1 Tax=Roseateles depolymerans TaxID=76731 RepID=A0A2W5E1W8_9BURK|nr:MAG: hypothetical protein DI603_01770 [Roseateles depolymerans]
MPAPTYAASSVQAGMYAELNALRSKAGAGLLAQSVLIDVAAQKHADYLHFNPADGHVEYAGKTGFYAASHTERIALAGYKAATATESIGGTGASFKGEDCSLGLLNSVYHAAAMLSSYTDVGVGSNVDGLGAPTCIYDFATPAGSSYVQIPASGALVAYPYAGQTDAPANFEAATEVPRPPVTVLPDALVGTPILVSIGNADYYNAKAAGTLSPSLTTFELRDSAGNLVPSVVLAGSGISGAGTVVNSDANLAGNWIVLVPKAPLNLGANYSVKFSATISSGTVVAKVWSFTTSTRTDMR